MGGAAAGSRTASPGPSRAPRARARSGSCGRARPRRTASGSRRAGRGGRGRETRWPRTSITDRSVCRNAFRDPDSFKRPQRPRDRVEVDRPCASPAALQPLAAAAERCQHRPLARRPQQRRRAGERGAAKQRAHLVAEAAARDQRQALGALGELVEELHRDPAAERVADDRGALDPRSRSAGRGCWRRGRRASSRRGPRPSRRGRSGRGRSPCSGRRGRAPPAPSGARS